MPSTGLHIFCKLIVAKIVICSLKTYSFCRIIDIRTSSATAQTVHIWQQRQAISQGLRETALSLSLGKEETSLFQAEAAVSISLSQKETERSLFLCSLSVPKKETVLSLSQRPAPVLETQRDSAQPNLDSSDLGSAACWLRLRDPQKHWIIGFFNEKLDLIWFYWILLDSWRKNCNFDSKTFDFLRKSNHFHQTHVFSFNNPIRSNQI